MTAPSQGSISNIVFAIMTRLSVVVTVEAQRVGRAQPAIARPPVARARLPQPFGPPSPPMHAQESCVGGEHGVQFPRPCHGERMRQRAALSLILALAPCAGAHAQSSSPSSAAAASSEAKESFRRGEAAYGAGNYEVAIKEWNDAFARDPRPRIQFNLSQAYERLGQLENAEASLVKFLESGDPDDPTYSDANARLVALRQRLASTGVIVKGGREGGLILVDDKDWGRTPRPDRINVSPGNHVVIVRWPGEPDFRTAVVVPAGQAVEVVVPGAPSSGPTVAAAAETPAPAPAPDASLRKQRALWFGLGGGLAGAGIGMIVSGAVRGSAEPSSCTSGTPYPEYYCNPADVEAADRQSIAGYVSGGVLLAGSAAMFIVGSIKTTKQAEPAHTSMPRCAFGLSSATCRLQF
jgi:hypothetical protein